MSMHSRIFMAALRLAVSAPLRAAIVVSVHPTRLP